MFERRKKMKMRCKRSTFLDRLRNNIKDEFGRTIPVLINWYNSHILIDSRLHWVDYEWNLIIKWLDDNKIRYIIETGKDEVYWASVGELTEREFKAIIIANDNFTDYDLLSRDSGKLSRDA
jgi:hypothetical protein